MNVIRADSRGEYLPIKESERQSDAVALVCGRRTAHDPHASRSRCLDVDVNQESSRPPSAVSPSSTPTQHRDGCRSAILETVQKAGVSWEVVTGGYPGAEMTEMEGPVSKKEK